MIQPGIGQREWVDQRHHTRRSVQPAEGHGLQSSIPGPADGSEADRVGVVLGQAGRASGWAATGPRPAPESRPRLSSRSIRGPSI